MTDPVVSELHQLVIALDDLKETIRREGRLNRAVALLGNPALDKTQIMKFLDDLK